MIIVLYCNISQLTNDDVETYLGRLPRFMQDEITRYKNVPDRSARLIARIILQHCLQGTGDAHLLDKWKRNTSDKPYLEGWYPFNISHSGDYVVFAYGNSDIGIDIEKKLDQNYEEMIDYFHLREQECILITENKRNKFYDLWAKKEAFLKAIGIGITGGLQEFDCTHDIIFYEGEYWQFHSLPIHSEYAGCLCCVASEKEITIREVLVDELAVF